MSQDLSLSSGGGLSFGVGSFRADEDLTSVTKKRGSSLSTVPTEWTTSTFTVASSGSAKETLQKFLRSCSEAYTAVRDYFLGGSSTEPLQAIKIAVDTRRGDKKTKLIEKFPGNDEIIKQFDQQHFHFRKISKYSLASYHELCEIGAKMKAGGAESEELASPAGYEKCRQYGIERSSIIYQAYALGIPEKEAKELFQNLFEADEKILWKKPGDKQEARARIKAQTDQIKEAWLKSGSLSASRFQYKEKNIDNAVKISKLEDTYPIPEAAARKILEEFFQANRDAMFDTTRNEGLLTEYYNECKKYSSLKKEIVDVILNCTDLKKEKAEKVLSQFMESQEEVPTCENLDHYLEKWTDYNKGRTLATSALCNRYSSKNAKETLARDEILKEFDRQFAHIRPRLPGAGVLTSWIKEAAAVSPAWTLKIGPAALSGGKPIARGISFTQEGKRDPTESEEGSDIPKHDPDREGGEFL